MKPRSATYKSFLDSIQNGSTSQLPEQSIGIIEHFRPAKQIASHFGPTTFLVDFATKKYIYVDDSCSKLLGYTAKFFLETGLEEYLSKWYEADFDVINKKVFPDNLAFFKTISSKHFADYIISYNYRFRNFKGEYLTLLQRSSYLPGPSGIGPIGMVGVVFDITHYKNDNTIVHTIEKVIKSEYETVNELVHKKVHPVYDVDGKNLLSKKELEILRCISDGQSSKQIADYMRLSINTINNHRRNMLAKIGCNSSSELTAYAIKHGLV